MASNAEWNEHPEETWYGASEPKQGVSIYRIIAVVIFLAAFLILSGFPLYDPLIFLSALVILSVFGLICGLMNRELVLALRGKR